MKIQTLLVFGMMIFFGGALSANPLTTPETAVDSTVLAIILPGNVKLEMKKIPAGSFLMGSPEDEPGVMRHEPQHRVTIAKDYWLGTFEVTQAQ